MRTHGTQVVPRKFLRPGKTPGALFFGGEAMKELPKIYDPKQVEKKIYDYWMDGG